jgi:hypothetical protein
MTRSVRRLKANKLFEGQRCGWSRQPLVFGEDIVVCNSCETPYKARLWESKGGCALPSCANAPLQRLPQQQPTGAEPLVATGAAQYPQHMQAMYPPRQTHAPAQQHPHQHSPEQHQAPPQPHAHHQAYAQPQQQQHQQQPPHPQQAQPGQRGRGDYPGVARRPRRAGLAADGAACIHCARQITFGMPFCPYCRQAQTPDGVYAGPTVNAPGAVASLVCGILGFFICGLILGIIAITKAQEAKRAIAADPRYTGAGMATAGMVLGIIDLVGFVITMLITFGAS